MDNQIELNGVAYNVVLSTATVVMRINSCSVGQGVNTLKWQFGRQEELIRWFMK